MFASKDTLLTRPSGGYSIARSVRLRSSASAYFNRTPSTTGSTQKLTYSAWVKRGTLGSVQHFGLSAAISSLLRDAIRFNSGDALEIFLNEASSAYLVTTQLFRDPSAWYHIVVAIDTTQATSSDRIKVYVNGVQVTAFSTSTYPSQNYNFTGWNVSGKEQNIGRSPQPLYYFDGYLTEINFVDGQQLTPSSFGETDSSTGVWKPKAYSGTYGTNGFELNFSDNSNNTAATIGKDYSGNGNNWTPNNISVTAGVTYDSMTDVPTLTSATAANFATWNPLDKRASGSTTYADGNLSSTVGAAASTEEAYVTMSFPTSGKWYCEVTVSNIASGNARIGIGNIAVAVDSRAANGYFYQQDGQKYVLGTASAYGSSWTTNDIIGVAFDANAGSITFYKNNTSQGAITGISATSQWLVGATGKATVLVINFGQRPFSYTPPTGFVALNTYNLPASTITNGAAYMAATTYTGTGASLTVANTVGSTSFQPDWVWVKSRSAATDHALYDSVRGVQKQIESNTTTAETTETTGLTAFGSTGFTVGALAQMNTSAATYVAWQWIAGTTSASNTNGSITSTVSAGATQGFSVVTYTGTGTAATIGHGLGVAPSMMIIKSRPTASTSWIVYHSSISPTNLLTLHTTAAQQNLPLYFNSTSPTSSVFSIGSAANTGVDLNVSSSTYVAYCFAAVAGYSAFGSYTGNGSTDGTFVYTGFRPRFVMIKCSSTTGNWIIWDSSRGTYNVIDSLRLYPNLSDVEGGGVDIDFVSNGFKFRNTNAVMNGASTTYIYAAFAEVPFKSALAR